MSRTNIDYLFQVPGADRSFALPRIDEPRPPFGDLLSQVSASTVAEPNRTEPRGDDRYAPPADDCAATSATTADDSHDSSRESTSSEASASSSAVDVARPDESSPATDEAHSDEGSPVTDEVHTDEGSPTTAEAHVATTNEASDDGAPATETEESSQAVDDDSNTDEEPALLAEAAVAQTAVKLNQPDAAITAGGAATLVAEGGAPDEAATASVEPQVDSVKRESRVPGEAAVDVIAETAETASATEQDAVAANIQADISDSTRPEKQTRTGQSTNSADRGRSADQKTVAGSRGESKSVVRAAAVAEVPIGDVLPKKGSTDPLAVDEQPAADESKGPQSDRVNSRPRADVTAIANKIVAAAVNGAAALANNSAAVENSDESKSVAKPQAAKGDALAAVAGRLHSQPAAGKRGAKTGGAVDAPQVDAARFVGRVTKAFQTAHERGGALQLRLNPPELGALRLELTVKDGVMSASLETENTAARRVLLDHLPALRERLAEQSIRVERFDVDVRREGGGQEPAPQNQQRDGQNQPESRRQPAAQSRSNDAAQPERPIVQPISSTSGINLVA